MAPSEKKEPLVAWREFAAGMEFLRRYGVHDTANSSGIRRDNLRLLHRALLQDSEYRKQTLDARRGAAGLTRPRWQILTCSRQLHAHLISMPANSSIRLTTQAGYLGMFLVIAGSAETLGRTETPTRPRHSWWPHRRLPSRQSHHYLKTNDVTCANPETADTGLLVTGKKTCVILAVFTATPASQRQPATVSDRPQAQQFPFSSAG
ncbi:MAG TPA: hypothetical protein ENK51_09780 [Gammaproteobacteria bacterium]|nr:hypothetical protein [Gammaproteobacteria bacterium]